MTVEEKLEYVAARFEMGGHSASMTRKGRETGSLEDYWEIIVRKLGDEPAAAFYYREAWLLGATAGRIWVEASTDAHIGWARAEEEAR